MVGLSAIESQNELFDEAWVRSSELSMEELRGHLILLSKMNDNGLRCAALVDGTSIDFVFGYKRNKLDDKHRSHIHRLKQYIQHLTEERQEAMVEYYGSLYQAIVIYHSQVNSCASCCYICFLCRAHSNFKQATQNAYNRLMERIR